MKLKFERKHFLYLVPSLIVSILLLVVFFVKGIYPFGNLTIIYTDMGQSYIPFCYHLYDVIMNGKSLFWDPFLGTGSNMFGIEAFLGMFSPISWLVIFSSREGIPYFASILLLVRMALMAAMAFLFFKNVFKDTKLFWQIALSVVYAFSGYVLILYTNTMWLDCAILFPLLMLMFKILLDREKIIGFILVLTASLIVCFYISFMVLLFVLFGGGVVILFYLDKTKRKKAVFHLGVATLTSLLLSSVVIIPAYLQSSGSARAAGFDYFNILKTQMISISYKGQYFIFAAIALVIVVKLAMHYKKDKKAVTAFGLLLALTTSQIVVESINLIWHTGSYAHFPMRFAFIPTLLLLAGAAYYFSKKNVLPLFKNDITQIGFGVLAAGTYVLAVKLGLEVGLVINQSMPSFGINDALTLQFFITTLLFGVSIWILLKFKETKLKYWLIGLVLVTEVLLHSMWYIGVLPQYSGGAEESVSWIYEANALKNDLQLESEGLSRYKDVDSVLNSNYPLVLGAPAVSTWIHMIEERQQIAYQQLGYSIVYTRILDTGGTMFSDMLLGVDNFFTKLNTNNAYSGTMFAQTGRSKDFTVYRNQYPLPFGIVFPRGNAEGNFMTNDVFENQNMIARTLFDKKDNLITLASETPQFADGAWRYDINVKGEQFLYANAAGTGSALMIQVNDKPLPIPTLGDLNNLQFPATFNSGLIPLGSFKDQTVHVKVFLPDTQGSAIDAFQIGMLPTAQLKTISTTLAPANTKPTISGNTVSFKLNAPDGDRSFFVPINFDKGWECTINGATVPIEPIFGTWMKVDLRQGENNISFRFAPTGFSLGLWLFLTTLLLGIVVFFLSKRVLFNENKLILNTTYYLFWFVFFGGILLVYVIPIISLLINSI